LSFTDIITNYGESSNVLATCKQLSQKNNVHLRGLCGSGSSFVISACAKILHDVHVIIFEDKESAAYALNDFQNILGENHVLFFPASWRYPYKTEAKDNANVLLRAETLNKLATTHATTVVVTYPEALSEKVITKKTLSQNTFGITKGDKLSIDFLNETLNDFDFERVDFVYEPGQFSIRGGILDIFSFAHEDPYRVEFFGDEIDSIRTFDASSQLSKKVLNKLTIVPNIQMHLSQESRITFLDFISNKCTIWIKDLSILLDNLDKEFEKAETAFEEIGKTIAHLPPNELFCNAKAIKEALSKKSVAEFGSKKYLSQQEITFQQYPQPTFNKNFALLSKNLYESVDQGYKNIITANNPQQLERLYRIFEDIEKEAKFETLNFAIHDGFTDKDLKINCYTDHQIFERFHRFKLKEGFKKATQALTIKELTDLQPGDFVTHIDHGVGKYRGLQKIDVNGKPQEAICLEYKDGDSLFVSIHSLHRIAKYTGKEGAAVTVHKIGAKTWQTQKQKTKTKVKEIAYDLISLYAKRKQQKGFQFSPDTYLQTELEASFMYEDTPDQSKATLAIKEDMESESPMDRLVCGDVGFGKTEIAIRAAFKAVADNKQVAILAPTTILTLQHFKTFRKRFEDFPCNVDFLNRFKSTKDQKETLRKLAAGEVDIIIGTHRLAGKDIKFKDLGLMIIDEEQKFGVSVKDKLKTIKTNVDTLTLTATPIPRTLQFSLMGARDLSTINTPPPNRHPVQTELHSFNEELIRDAIAYEVSRGGQVFFVHNRIENLPDVAGMIQRMLPDVKIAWAHGQMDPKKLENIMTEFIEGAHDVLISTTIIESGLDISNANTIIINSAHMFGLSDLHQMRGRVGRSNKKAFCYLLSPPISSLTPEARKRLNAIEQFSDIGSGFNIAMRDLDIRGAGNLLGADQSGFISDVGLETFKKILDEAIEELKENEFKEVFKDETNKVFVKDCQIETDLEILISDEFVNNITERLALYKELDSIEKEVDLAKFEKNLLDRFGEIPSPTEELFNTIRLRWLAKDVGLEKLVLKHNKLIGYFVGDQTSRYYQSENFTKVLSYVQQHSKTCRMKEKNEKLMLVFENIKSIKQATSTLRPILG
jgi:transcription-repair coupling factor (superfamily II helicase)